MPQSLPHAPSCLQEKKYGRIFLFHLMSLAVTLYRVLLVGMQTSICAVLWGMYAGFCITSNMGNMEVYICMCTLYNGELRTCS